MSCATRRSIACDSVMKTLSDRLTRGLQNHRRVAARWPSRAPGCCSGEVKCRALDERSGMSRSAPADARAGGVLRLVQPSAKRSSTKERLPARADTPRPPQGGFERSHRHNAQSIMRSARSRAVRAVRPRIMGAMSMCPHSERRRSLKRAARRRSVLSPARPCAAHGPRASRALPCAAPRRPRGLPVVASLRRASRGGCRSHARACERRTAFAAGLQRLAPCSHRQGLREWLAKPSHP